MDEVVCQMWLRHETRHTLVMSASQSLTQTPLRTWTFATRTRHWRRSSRCCFQSKTQTKDSSVVMCCQPYSAGSPAVAGQTQSTSSPFLTHFAGSSTATRIFSYSDGLLLSHIGCCFYYASSAKLARWLTYILENCLLSTKLYCLATEPHGCLWITCLVVMWSWNESATSQSLGPLGHLITWLWVKM